MRAVCGIDIGNDRMSVSFAGLVGRRLKFLKEIDVEIPSREEDFLGRLKDSAQVLSEKLSQQEKSLSCVIEDIFLTLPDRSLHRKEVEDIIPLRKRKRISTQDLLFARKYLTDMFLDWDDFCVHHFVSAYEVEGKVYVNAPLGVMAKKLKLNSRLIWIKDKVRKETDNFFDGLGRSFGGFVSQEAGVFSSVFSPPLLKNDYRLQRYKESVFCVFNIGYDDSSLVIFKEGDLGRAVEFNFGLKKIIAAISNRFLLSHSLAQEVLMRYVSFKKLPFFKEVSIKDGNSYINLSNQALNSFVQEYIKGEISSIIEKTRETIFSQPAVVSFIGKLASKEGFFGFIKDFMPLNIKVFAALGDDSATAAFGCLRYGLNRFLEKTPMIKSGYLRRIMNIYSEYF